MATLTSDQLSDIQADLGIDATEAVFSDTELNRLYTRADSDYDTAVYLAWRQLLADANKFADYTIGHHSEKRSQIRQHIKDMVSFWQAESRTAANQFKIVGAVEVPHRHKDKPGDLLKRTREDLLNAIR